MTKKKKEQAKEQRVLMKDNLLIRTKYDLTLVENRLYTLILYKFQKEGEVLKCTITPEEAREVIKKKSDNSVKGIGEILDKLSTKKIWIEEKKANGINSKWHKYNLLNGCTYDDEFKTFEVQATAFIYELIKKKFDNGGYTPINMNIFLTLGNYYSQRLYDLLRLWSNSKTVINYSVDELKELLMVTDKYQLYGDFKRRVITPAVKGLNECGAFDIEIKEIKEGRKVVSIDFMVKDLDKRKYFKNIPFVEVPTVLKDDTGEDIKENAPASAIAEAVITSFGNYTSNNSKRMERNKKQEEILNISPSGNYIMNNSKRLKGKVVTSEQLKKSEELENDLTFWYIQE